MANINTTMSIIILNINILNTPQKYAVFQNECVLYKKSILNIKFRVGESKIMEKYIQC